MELYFDHAATTPVDPRVVVAMAQCLAAAPGNPAATHAAGRAARERIELARAEVAGLIGAPPAAIVFTSGATEANNLAIQGAARGLGDGCRLVTLRTEHRAVLDPCRRLERDGHRLTMLTPGRDGRIDPAAIGAALDSQPTLVSVMLVNNETGVLQDIAAIAAQCRRRGALLHVDAAQAAGRVPIDVVALDVDLLSLSAHKIHGPAGVGALYVRRVPRPALVPLLLGGGQEGALRAGTLAGHQILGMGVAYRLAGEQAAAECAALLVLRERLWAGLAVLPGMHLNGAPEWRAPHILNVSCEGVDGEALLAGLGDLTVASGAACGAESGEPSYVLRALGRDEALAQASLRFSLGRTSTAAGVDAALAIVCGTVQRLRALAPA